MVNVMGIDQALLADRSQALTSDIKRAFGTQFIPTLFRAMAPYPGDLEVAWELFKECTALDSLDAQTRLAIALVTNHWEQDIGASMASLMTRGFGAAEITELVATVDILDAFTRDLDAFRADLTSAYPDRGQPFD